MAMPNTITVRLFARLAELAGTREMELDIGEGLTAADAYRLLARRDPALAGFEASLAYARNREYVGGDTPLAPGDELALIPPVSGGSRSAGGSAARPYDLRLGVGCSK